MVGFVVCNLYYYIKMVHGTHLHVEETRMEIGQEYHHEDIILQMETNRMPLTVENKKEREN